MASLRNCSREMLDVARNGVGWIALWKVGRSWEVSDFYPLPDFKAGVLEICSSSGLLEQTSLDHSFMVVFPPLDS